MEKTRGLALGKCWRRTDFEPMIESEPTGVGSNSWSTAARLLGRWLAHDERVDELLEGLPTSLSRVERARVQNLLFGSIRHLGRIEAHLGILMSHAPRTKLKAILLIAGYELIEGGAEGHAARVVHHAVEQTKTLASKSEAGLVNAVVRKLATRLSEEVEPAPDASLADLARWYSHPQWLVERWAAQFGQANARSLLIWNQQPSPLYARWRARDRTPGPAELEWLKPTNWPGFYEIRSGHWPEVVPLLTAGDLYVQDPATRLPLDLLAPRPGERVLDVCAAPGGKSLAIADMIGQGQVVACDLPSPRLDRLKTNLALAPSGVDVAIVPGDLERESAGLLKQYGLPTTFPAVLVDVPCSNTGVMRHRVDVKWRLQEGDFAKHARQQLALLSAAAGRVAPGGRIVYSTCSVDVVENEKVVETFTRKSAGRFTLAAQKLSRPWESGHDGAAAFLLERTG